MYIHPPYMHIYTYTYSYIHIYVYLYTYIHSYVVKLRQIRCLYLIFATCLGIEETNILCVYFAQSKRELFGDHFRIFFLNSSEDLVFLILGGKIAHIIGPKEDIVSNP